MNHDQRHIRSVLGENTTLRSGSSVPGLYEPALITSFLLFLRAMQLYGEINQRATGNPKLIRNPKIQKSLAQIIETVEACGAGLERLPAPPTGAEAVDCQFRELGKEIRCFARILKELATLPSGRASQPAIQEFAARAERVKRNFREAFLAYERIFPGQLTDRLRLTTLEK